MDPQFAFFDNPLGGFLKSCPYLQSGESGNIIKLGDVIPPLPPSRGEFALSEFLISTALGEGRSRGNGQNGSRSASLDSLVTATKFVMGLTDHDNCRKGKPRWACKAGTAPHEAIRRLDQMAALGSVFSPGGMRVTCTQGRFWGQSSSQK